MAKQKPDKFTTGATPEKNCQDKPFVQAQGELNQTQLEAIAGGIMTYN